MMKFLCSACVAALFLALPNIAVPAQGQTETGYIAVSPLSGSRTPGASALLSYSNPNGILVSRTAVPASDAIRNGVVFLDEVETRSSIAITNFSDGDAVLQFSLRNSSGKEIGALTTSLHSGQQLSKYVAELFPNVAVIPTGSLQFNSDRAVYAVALRENRNKYGDAVFTAVPFMDSSRVSNEPIVLPHIAGEGFTTQFFVINSGSRATAGRMRFTNSNGETSDELPFEIPPKGIFSAQLPGDGIGGGYARVLTDDADASVSAIAIVQQTSAGQVISETAMPAGPAATFARTFIDTTEGRTKLVLVNPSSDTSVVAFTLTDRFGNLEITVNRTIAPGGQFVSFSDELFQNLPADFSGLIETRSATPIVAAALRVTTNSRNDAVLTAVPSVVDGQVSSAAALVIPQFAIGNGFALRLIVISLDSERSTDGTLRFFHPDGTEFPIPMSGTRAAVFPFRVTPSGGRQFYPGNSINWARLDVIDPDSNLNANEITVNEGNSLRVRLRVLDATGRIRDDFDPQYVSFNTGVASISERGVIEGRNVGFSTLSVTAAGLVTNVTVNVVGINSGAIGFETRGVTRNQAGQLYIAAPQEQAIFVSDALSKAPQVYAGVQGTAGLKNDVRRESLFNNPGYLALDQSGGTFGGSLYVSDTTNHVIRRVRPGPSGRVETIAESFSSPQGVALDSRANLWVADAGSHVIRRINLSTGLVETIGGKEGASGFADGRGEDARFNAPAGIAVVPESSASELERARTGQPPPPITLVVADSGNGTIRRITENGEVSTIGVTGSSATFTGLQRDAAPTLVFPTNVAADAIGNVYVAEPVAHRVSLVLKNGLVVAAAQTNTFQNPSGLVLSGSGRVIVTDQKRAAIEIRYGAPKITRVDPSRADIRGGQKVTVLGNNFAPDTVVVLGGTLISGVSVANTETLTFTSPAGLPSGITTITVQNRGGLDQASMLIEPVKLAELPAGNITTFAGGSTFAGDGSLATSATLLSASSLAVDLAGNVYIADTGNHRIRKISATTGVITTVAGTGQSGFSGDNGIATAAKLSYPWGVAVNASGDLFISDNQNHRVRKVNGATGVITTVAGTGEPGYTGDGVPATTAKLSSPFGLAVDPDGNLIIADTGNYRLRKLDTRSGTIATIAGTGQSGFSGDNGRAIEAEFAFPFAISIDTSGNVFIADTFNQRIRKLSRDTGIITTIAGSGRDGFSGDGGPATAAALHNPLGVAVDAAGDVYIADQENHRVRKVTAGANLMSTIAGRSDPGFSGDGKDASLAELAFPYGIVVDGAGNLLIGDAGNHRVRKITATTQTMTTIAGNGENVSIGDEGPAIAAQLGFPSGLAFDALGNLLIADTTNHRIRKVAAKTGSIISIAGNDPAESLSFPQAVAVDAAGNIFIADTNNHRIRKIDAETGSIATIAGTGDAGFSGDDGYAVTALLNSPKGIATDRAGNLFVADTFNHRVRKIDAATGIIMTVAGNGDAGFSGDEGFARFAKLSYPMSVVVDGSGNLYIADNVNSRVRKVDALTGIITTIAGNGRFEFSGDGGPAAAAGLDQPRALALDTAGNLVIADQYNGRIRRLDLKTGIITTVAGSGQSGIAGDNGPALNAAFDQPFALAVDSAGNIFIADAPNNRVRVVRSPVH